MSARKVGGEKTAAQVRHVFVVSRAQMHDGLGSQTVIRFFPRPNAVLSDSLYAFFYILPNIKDIWQTISQNVRKYNYSWENFCQAL